jgi:hypothetical protein
LLAALLAMRAARRVAARAQASPPEGAA